MGIAILMVEQNARQALKGGALGLPARDRPHRRKRPAAEIGAKESVQAVFLGGHA